MKTLHLHILKFHINKYHILSKIHRKHFVNSMLSFVSHTCRNGSDLPSLKCHHWLITDLIISHVSFESFPCTTVSPKQQKLSLFIVQQRMLSCLILLCTKRGKQMAFVLNIIKIPLIWCLLKMKQSLRQTFIS